MKYFLLSLLVIAINLSLYSQTKEFENDFELNLHHLRGAEADKFKKHKLNHFGQSTDKIDLQLNKYFVSEVLDVVDSVIVTKEGNSIEKYSYTYDNNGNWIVSSFRIWEDSSWVGYNNKYNYNENGFLVSEYRGCIKTMLNPTGNPMFIDVAIDSCYMYTYTYDSNGNTNSILCKKREDETNWVNYFRDAYTYDDNENMTSELRAIWEDTDWVNNMRDTYTYDDNGNMTSKLLEKWEGADWVNNMRDTYTYDNSGNITSKLRARWVGSDWEDKIRDAYTYDGNGNITSKLLERWLGTDWVEYWRHTYNYNNNGNMTLDLYEYWDGTNWVNSTRYTYTYDDNGSMTLFLPETWDDTNWINSNLNAYLTFRDTFGNYYSFSGIKIEVSYKTITEVEQENNNYFSYTLQQNYPNPFNPSTTISYSLPKAGFVQLKVYDLLGREVAVLVNKEQIKGNYKINFNASNLTSGIYFYKLQSGIFSDTKKLILLR